MGSKRFSAFIMWMVVWFGQERNRLVRFALKKSSNVIDDGPQIRKRTILEENAERFFRVDTDFFALQQEVRSYRGDYEPLFRSAAMCQPKYGSIAEQK